MLEQNVKEPQGSATLALSAVNLTTVFQINQWNSSSRFVNPGAPVCISTASCRHCSSMLPHRLPEFKMSLSVFHPLARQRHGVPHRHRQLLNIATPSWLLPFLCANLWRERSGRMFSSNWASFGREFDSLFTFRWHIDYRFVL